MTISTKPEDIDSPETILHFMESYPASGRNCAAAKLIRELLAAVLGLIAARDDKLVEMTQQEFDDFEDWWLTIPVHEETIIDMKHVRMAWLAGRSSLAGQVAPQATEGTPFGWLVTFHGCNPQFVIDRTFVEDVAKRGVEIKADIALFDHPTSKATEQRELILAGSDLEDQLQNILVRVVEAAVIPDHGSRSRALYEELRGWINDLALMSTSKATEKSALSEIQDQLTRMLHTAAVLTDAEFVTGYQVKTGALHSILGTMQGAGFPVEVPLPQNTIATSKADTSEALRKLVFTYFENNVGENLFNQMSAARLLLFATPSTIKAEPTGEQL